MIDLNAYLSFENGRTVLDKLPCFDPFLSSDCGQAFRWVKDDSGILSGVIGRCVVHVEQLAPGRFAFDAEKEFFLETVAPYFDLFRDYEAIIKKYDDPHLIEAVGHCPGIRIMKQDEWEALCSFIISQNNNIPRIKGIIERLCAAFGERIDETHFSFPSVEKLAPLSVEDLAPLRAGFRAKYIIDAARKVSGGEVDLERISSLSLDEAEEELKKIKGVGKKVAMCALLYGFGMIDAFPEDVWVKRIMAELYPEGLPECTDGTRGIAQQYLFTWYRDIS